MNKLILFVVSFVLVVPLCLIAGKDETDMAELQVLATLVNDLPKDQKCLMCKEDCDSGEQVSFSVKNSDRTVYFCQSCTTHTMSFLKKDEEGLSKKIKTKIGSFFNSPIKRVGWIFGITTTTWVGLMMLSIWWKMQTSICCEGGIQDYWCNGPYYAFDVPIFGSCDAYGNSTYSSSGEQKNDQIEHLMTSLLQVLGLW